MLPNTNCHVALLRGINVGASTRLAMADLRSIFASAGLENVRTHLQSGNVVFTGNPDAHELDTAILDATGVRTRVLIVPGVRFAEIALANPLADVVTDPSRGVITFLDVVPDNLQVPEDLGDERLVVGEHAVYQWLPDGILKTRVPAAFQRSLGPLATARNLRTVAKIVEMVSS